MPIMFLDKNRFKPNKIKTPYPAHRDCAHLMIEQKEYRKWIMVHGFIKRGKGYKRYAWLEKTGMAFDVVAKKLVKKSEFYKTKKPTAKELFTYREVKYNMKRFRRYGRWDV